MSQALTTALTIVSLALAGWSIVLVVANRPIGNTLFYGLVLVELVTLAVVVGAVVAMIGGSRPDGMATFISYLVLLPFVLPAAAFWALIERSRWGTAVILVAALVLPVLAVRVQQLWGAAHA